MKWEWATIREVKGLRDRLVMDAINEGRDKMNMEMVRELFETIEENFPIEKMLEDKTPSAQAAAISVEGQDGNLVHLYGPDGDGAQGDSVRRGGRMLSTL